MILADTNAVVYSGPNFLVDDPATGLPGFPSTNAILQSRKVNFTLTNLGTTTKIYTSGYKADIVALAEFYADLGCTIDIEEGPVYKIQVAFLTTSLQTLIVTQLNLPFGKSCQMLWSVTS